MRARGSDIFILIVACSIILTGCGAPGGNAAEIGDGPVKVVATTTLIADAVRNVGGEHVEVEALMGPGVDPHEYIASESDVTRMSEAHIILYNGHHLEGAMSDVLSQVSEYTRTLAVAEQVDEDLLIEPDVDLLGADFEAPYDPHIWFDVGLWKIAVEAIRDELIDINPENEAAYRENTEEYLAELDELDQYIQGRIEELPQSQRVVITAHDAFGYLGNAYGFDVRGLQPVTTDVEAGASDIRDLADLIVDQQIHAIFLETSVPPQGIEAVREAVNNRDFEVRIADDPLYGDALGEAGTEHGSYIGAYTFNINTIVDALKGQPTAEAFGPLAAERTGTGSTP